jgi:non-ribosomal peptide synthetase component E (peptide arylation enzyme)
MKQLQVNLPDALAQQVLAAGLWEPQALTDLLTAELHRRETAQTIAKLEGLHQANQAFLSESQVMEEVKAYRHERRESRS